LSCDFSTTNVDMTTALAIYRAKLNSVTTARQFNSWWVFGIAINHHQRWRSCSKNFFIFPASH